MKHKSWIILIMLFSLTTGAIAQNSSIKLQGQALKFNKSALIDKAQGRYVAAEEKHKIALDIYKKLAMKNPKFYSEVGVTIDYLGKLDEHRKSSDLKHKMWLDALKANHDTAMKAASIRIGGDDCY